MAAVAASGSASWSVKLYSPDRFDSSVAATGWQGTPYGWGDMGPIAHAIRFDSTHSFTSYHPGLDFATRINKVDGTYAWGTRSGPNSTVFKWDLNTGIYKVLNAEGADQAYVHDAWQGVAVGNMSKHSWQRAASMWDVNDNPTELHPTGFSFSDAFALDNHHQYGYTANLKDEPLAARWSGTAASYVSMHPDGYKRSSIRAASRTGLQAGWALGPGDYEAMVWNGTAESALSLHPAGYTSSAAQAAAGGFQAGWVKTGDHEMAAAWTGSAGSFVDLHAVALLQKPGLTGSTIYDAEIYNNTVYFYGYVYTGAFDHIQAAVWSQPVPEPASLTALALGALAAMRRRVRRR